MGALDVPGITRKQSAAIAQMSLQDRLSTEGYPYTSTAAVNGITVANNTSLGAFTLPGLTRAFWIDSIIVSSNKNMAIQIGMSANYIGGGSYPFFTEVIVGPGSTTVIPVRQFFRPAGYTTSTGSVSLGGASVRNLIDADGTNTYTRISIVGSSIADDLNFGAEKVLLHIGDSISGAGTGPTSKVKQYDWQTLNYFKDKGHDVRMVNLSVSGSTTQDHERLRQYGTYDLPKVDFIAYSLGANDASAGNSSALVKSNIAAMIAHKKARYPNAKMIVYGSTPHENNTNETNAVALRTAASEAVTEAADSKVVYLNLGGAFDRLVASNYASGDAAGNRIHPSDAGHAAIWTVIKNFLDANPAVRP